MCAWHQIEASYTPDPLRHCYYMQEEQIKSVSHTKYLGVIIDEHLSFNEHIEMIANKANSVKSFL